MASTWLHRLFDKELQAQVEYTKVHRIQKLKNGNTSVSDVSALLDEATRFLAGLSLESKVDREKQRALVGRLRYVLGRSAL